MTGMPTIGAVADSSSSATRDDNFVGVCTSIKAQYNNNDIQCRVVGYEGPQEGNIPDTKLHWYRPITSQHASLSGNSGSQKFNPGTNMRINGGFAFGSFVGNGDEIKLKKNAFVQDKQEYPELPGVPVNQRKQNSKQIQFVLRTRPKENLMPDGENAGLTHGAQA